MSGLWRFPCDAEDCAPANDRPYARDKKYASATTLGGMLDKPGLSWGAAKETGVFLYHHDRELRSLGYDEYVERARRHHRGLWDKAALMGTLAHHAGQTWAYGGEWTLPTEWKGKPLELSVEETAQTYTYVDGLFDWWQHRDPQVLASELIVRHDDPDVIGSVDQLAEVADSAVIADFKFTKNIDKDPYERDWFNQLNTYGLCDTLCHYHQGKLVATLPWAESGLPVPTHGLIVNVQGDGSWREYWCELDRAMAAEWVASMVAVKRQKPAMKLGAVGNQAEVNVGTYDEVAAAKQAAVMLG